MLKAICDTNTAFHSVIRANFVLEKSGTACVPETVPPVSCPAILFETSYVFMLQVPLSI